MGNGGRNFLRNRPPAPRPRHLGLSSNRRCCGRRMAHTISPALRTPLAIALALLVTLAGIPAATRVARASGVKDPQFVVIDEVAGQLIALIAVPLEWKSFLASLILFRAFDIVKPPPVRQLEAIPEGAGIVLDDVAAGLYALAAVHLLLHFGLLT